MAETDGTCLPTQAVQHHVPIVRVVSQPRSLLINLRASLERTASHDDKSLEAFTDRVNFPDQIVIERSGEGSRITRTC